jgi:hypothetical protein
MRHCDNGEEAKFLDDREVILTILKIICMEKSKLGKLGTE